MLNLTYRTKLKKKKKQFSAPALSFNISSMSTNYISTFSCNLQGKVKSANALEPRSQNCEKRLLASSCVSSCNNSVPTGQIMKFYIWVLFENRSRKLKFHEIGHELRTLHMTTNIYFGSNLAHFFLEWEMFQINVAEKIKTHILCSTLFLNRAVYENVEKYCRARQATDDNTAHAHCMLDT